MSAERSDEAQFNVSHHAEAPETLIAGFSSFGLAGMTAVDYIAEQCDYEPTGHVAANVPTITPFEDGRPRYPTRLLSAPSEPITVLLNEQLIPTWAAHQFADSLLEWGQENGVEEVTVLAGVPFAHGPDDHRTFFIATDDYREHRLTGTDVPAMASGFLDGVNAALVQRGMSSPLRVGVLVTPVHDKIPDAEAALRLLETTRDLYDLAVDLGPLEQFATDVEAYYAELAERVRNTEESDVPEDRMFG